MTILDMILLVIGVAAGIVVGNLTNNFIRERKPNKRQRKEELLLNTNLKIAEMQSAMMKKAYGMIDNTLKWTEETFGELAEKFKKELEVSE